MCVSVDGGEGVGAREGGTLEEGFKGDLVQSEGSRTFREDIRDLER